MFGRVTLLQAVSFTERIYFDQKYSTYRAFFPKAIEKFHLSQIPRGNRAETDGE